MKTTIRRASPDVKESNFHSQQEKEKAIADLDGNAIYQLSKLSKSFVWKTGIVDRCQAEDLLQDTFEVALSQGRRWQQKLSITSFLWNCMKDSARDIYLQPKLIPFPVDGDIATLSEDLLGTDKKSDLKTKEDVEEAEYFLKFIFGENSIEEQFLRMQALRVSMEDIASELSNFGYTYNAVKKQTERILKKFWKSI